MLPVLPRMILSFLSCCSTDQFWIAYVLVLDFLVVCFDVGTLPHACVTDLPRVYSTFFSQYRATLWLSGPSRGSSDEPA